MRYGLMTNLRRSWSAIGQRVVLDHQQAYANSYLFSAIAPFTGENFHFLLPAMDGDMTYLFLRELKKQHPTQHVVVVWDNAPCHRRKDMQEIDGLTVVPLPPYSPELNPAERYFEEIRRVTANRVFESLEKQEELITEAIKKWDVCDKIKRLAGYGWIREQCGEVS